MPKNLGSCFWTYLKSSIKGSNFLWGVVSKALRIEILKSCSVPRNAVRYEKSGAGVVETEEEPPAALVETRRGGLVVAAFLILCM